MSRPCKTDNLHPLVQFIYRQTINGVTTRAALARKSGVPIRTIEGYFLGHHPTLPRLDKLVQALGYQLLPVRTTEPGQHKAVKLV